MAKINVYFNGKNYSIDEDKLANATTGLEKAINILINGKPSKGLVYTLNNDQASYSVSGKGTCTDDTIIIPSEYEGLPVTKIAARAFLMSVPFSTIVIPNSVTVIGEKAFENSSLRTIIIPDSVVTIEQGAFNYCRALDGEVVLSKSITKINKYLFSESDIASIIIPDGVTTIETSAFYYCDRLHTVTIPNSVQYIGQGAFSDCPNLTRINYTGTMAEWNAIEFYFYETDYGAIQSWDDDTGNYTVYCTDGNIKKK